MWLDIERQRSCKPPHAGANPAVGSACPGGVADSIGLSEGPGPGSTPGRDNVAKKSCECAGQHGSLRNCKTRFDSSAGHSGPRGVADASDLAKVGDQVRLLTRMLMTLELDGWPPFIDVLGMTIAIGANSSHPTAGAYKR